MMVISVYYTSHLYSKLTVLKPQLLFDGFQSVLDDGNYVVGLIKGYAIQTELEVSYHWNFEEKHEKNKL